MSICRVLMHLTILISAVVVFHTQAEAGQASKDFRAAQHQYLATAEKYRSKADELDNKLATFPPALQKIVPHLVQTYVYLADTKVLLAEAIGKRDWEREEELENYYYKLKAHEKMLWHDIDASKK